MSDVFSNIDMAADLAHRWTEDLANSRIIKYLGLSAQQSWHAIIAHQRDVTATRNSFSDSDYVSNAQNPKSDFYPNVIFSFWEFFYYFGFLLLNRIILLTHIALPKA